MSETFYSRKSYSRMQMSVHSFVGPHAHQPLRCVILELFLQITPSYPEYFDMHKNKNFCENFVKIGVFKVCGNGFKDSLLCRQGVYKCKTVQLDAGTVFVKADTLKFQKKFGPFFIINLHNMSSQDTIFGKKNLPIKVPQGSTALK